MRSMVIFGLVLVACTTILEARLIYKREAIPAELDTPDSKKEKTDDKDVTIALGTDSKEDIKEEQKQNSKEDEDELAKTGLLAFMAVYADPETHKPHLFVKEISLEAAKTLLSYEE